MCNHPHISCCLSGLLLFCAPIVLFCTGPLVYKYYNHAIGFKATRCSISTSTHGTKKSSCSHYGGCDYIRCTSFQVMYDDSEEMNNSDGLHKSQSIGYLNPDETSIRDSGWCYPDPPTCCKDVNRTFDCFFNPNNKQEVIERRIFTRAGAINSLFWPLLAIFTSAMFAVFYCVIYMPSIDKVIEKGNVLHLKLIMRIRKVPEYRLLNLLKLSSTHRSAKCAKVIFKYYKQSELDDLLVTICGSSVSYIYYPDDKRTTCVNLLIDFGANVRYSDINGNTALHHAASAGRLGCVVLLLQHHVQSVDAVRLHTINVNVKNNKGRTPLFEAYMNVSRPRKIIQALLHAGSDVNTHDSEGKTVLQYASEHGFNLMPLLKHGADPNVSDHKGNTILHVAASKGHLSGVEALLNPGSPWTSITARINVNAKNNERQTPLILACVSGPQKKGTWEGIIETLVKAGSDVNTQDIDGKTALHYIAENELDLMSLLKHGANPTVSDHKGNTILHIAASKGNSSGVRALLNLHVGFSWVPFAPKINVNARNIEKQTPLVIACMNHRDDIIESLINAGCDVNIRDGQGGTALFYAVQRTLKASVLLARDSDPFVYHSSGYTAFELAVTHRHLDTTIELVRNNSVPREIFSTRNGSNLLNIVLNQKSYAISRALLIGGYDRAPLLNWIQILSLSDSWPDEEDEEEADMEWIMEYATNPSPLRHLSCLAIRRSIKRRIVSSVEQLPLPRTLRDYVSLKDLFSCRA